jgi:hypothetical protein
MIISEWLVLSSALQVSGYRVQGFPATCNLELFVMRSFKNENKKLLLSTNYMPARSIVCTTLVFQITGME